MKNILFNLEIITLLITANLLSIFDNEESRRKRY
jgi:hypothetical protein